jgi:hypothetical protein
MISTVTVAVYAALIAASLTLGIYLLTTNPPKDESAFLGVGKEKLSEQELAETDR